jgi:hypothetical protein
MNFIRILFYSALTIVFLFSLPNSPLAQEIDCSLASEQEGCAKPLTEKDKIDNCEIDEENCSLVNNTEQGLEENNAPEKISDENTEKEEKKQVEIKKQKEIKEISDDKNIKWGKPY